MKLKKLLDEALFWGGSKHKTFTESCNVCNCTDCKCNEDGTFMPVDVRTKHDVQTEAKFNTKGFLKAVRDEFDVETLQLMHGVIDKQIKLVQKMGDVANPRKVVKGFRK